MYGPRTLLEAVYETGRKGISLQRYKGLGEMNPEQLWETTLDRDARTLLQVKIGDLAEADEIFSKLMGDVVEPRREAHTLDLALLGSLDARRLNERHKYLAEVYATPAKLRRKSEIIPVYGPRTLLEAIYEAGKKGISMQRYKGLGEMNPDQLWETTLNPDVRTLLQVKVGEVTEADEIFSKLMGDVVEPRREFIQENALTVANLDV